MKGFNFKSDASQAPRSEKKGRKRGVFNFNKSDMSDDDQLENKQFRKYNNNMSLNTKESMSNQSFENKQNTGMSIKQNESKTNNQKSNATLQKQPQRHKAQTITITQRDYIEKLFFSIGSQNEQSQFRELVLNKRLLSSDELVKKEALLFLGLYHMIIKQKGSFKMKNAQQGFEAVQYGLMPNKQTNLKLWALFHLYNNKQFHSFFLSKKVSNDWMLLAHGKIDELANKFLRQNDYEQALLVSNLQDRSFVQSFQFNSSKKMKKQYNLIQSRDIRITPNLVWLVDLAISLNYFDESQLKEYIRQIFIKYHNSQQNISPALEPALLALTLAYNKDRIDQKMIERMITPQKRLHYLRQVLFFCALKDHQLRYPRIMKKLTISLINLLRNPEIFVELLMVQELPQRQIIQYLDYYLRNNPTYLSEKQQRLKQLYQAIEQRAILSNLQSQDYLAIKILYEWMICQKYVQISKQKKYLSSLAFFIDNCEQIKSSKTHQYKQIVDLLIKNVIRFQLACTYNSQSRRAYYCQLQKLQQIIQTKEEKSIILGCMAYLQLKFKVFWFHSSEKLTHLYSLFLFLRKSSSEHTLFITNIRKTLQAIFTTLEGKLYITELSSNPNIKDKIQLAELMKKQVNCQSDLSSTDFGKTELYKILEMLNWNNKVVNFVVVKLLFH